ncbi:MAG: cytochrome C, partial [Verrucomicrobiota bacterium]|nr:cytochrome C [Verrucomicrobiota bacterium]
MEPPQALAAFQIKGGFRVELAAAEPNVVDPVAMAFDENGRLFVAEMRDYPERRKERLGTIRLLEDTDADGVYEKSTVFAKHLGWPTTVICYGGGLFVGAVPDIVWLKDTNGDGVADERKVIFTGFSPGENPEIAPRCFKGFQWGLDNRIHGATSGNGGSVTAVAGALREPIDLRGRDFSFDPRTLTMRAESGAAQFGLSFDERGRKFVCSNSHHIQTVMYEDRYTQRNPLFAMRPALVDIAADGPAASIFRISPDEPWRILRTRWRVEGRVKGPIESGRPSGNFTSAAGIT